MSRTIWKFRIELGSNPIEVFGEAKVLRAGLDPLGMPCVWVETEKSGSGAPDTVLAVDVIGTGHDVPAGKDYVNSYVDGPFVWHVYSGGAR